MCIEYYTDYLLIRRCDQTCIPMRKNDLSRREEHLHNGTVLSAYQYRLPIQPVGREKMIVSRNFSSYISVHKCFDCKQMHVPVNIARIAHFRSHVFNGKYEFSDTLSNKTHFLQLELQRLFNSLVL